MVAASCAAPPGICDKAVAFQQALLVRKDFEWIVQNYRPPAFVVCNSTDPSGYFGSAPPELCEGAASNENRLVYNVAGKIVLAEGLKRELRAWVESPDAPTGDQYGPAQSRLYTIGCKTTPGQPHCHDNMTLVFSKIPADSAVRSHLIFLIDSPSNPSLSAFLGVIPEPSHIDPALRGGEAYGFFGPRGRLAVFYAVP